MTMPRIARSVFAEIPHHIIQRGNRGEDVFFKNGDRYEYLKKLKEYAKKHNVKILAYCLMSNHIHLIAIPKNKEGLQRVLKPVHMRYAQFINRQHLWSGHLWQGRFFSSPLDEAYLWFCVRYIERNPVRAKIVEKAEDYPWSSASAHCGLKKDNLLSTNTHYWKIFNDIQDWSAWLKEEDEDENLIITRRNIQKNLPCGSDNFIEKLEKISGNLLKFRPVGRPKKG